MNGELLIGDRFCIVKDEDGEPLEKSRTVEITTLYPESVTFRGLNITRRYLAELVADGRWQRLAPAKRDSNGRFQK